jgi:uncharacterized repeat protein (TIGR01451 family)
MMSTWSSTALGARQPSIRAPQEINPDPPPETAKLIFVHASVGDMWLGEWYGQLGSFPDGGDPTYFAETTLHDNNYFVSDYNGPHEHENEWPEHDYCVWRDLFSNPDWMDRMLNYSTADGNYGRLADPGGENDIIMIKPCFTQYPIGGAPGDEPSPPGSACTGNGTVADIKRAMLDLLDVLAQHPDKFFVLVTAPPKPEDTMENGDTARAVANWMVHEMLDGYDVGNVMVFDLYNVLTSNHQGPGDPCQIDEDDQSDVGMVTGNHHRVWQGEIQHQVGYDQTYSAYCDGHQKKGGLRKATSELVPLLNVYYNAWLSGTSLEGPTAEAGGPYARNEGASITFDGSASTDPAGGSLSYAWDLDDDGAYDDAFQAVTSNTWGEPGTHTVGLKITTSEGVTDTDTASVTVNNLPPVADAGGPYGGYEGASISLSGSGSDPGGGTLTYAWDLDGDGDHDDAFTPNPTCTWETPGTYAVSLAVTDVQGSVDTDSASVLVNALGSIAVSPPTAEYGGRVTYTIAALGAGRPMTITDPLPNGLAYVVDSAVVSPTIGTLSVVGDEVRWTGELGSNEWLEIDFAATVVETGPASIQNFVYVDYGDQTHEWGVALIVNPYHTVIPLVMNGP